MLRTLPAKTRRRLPLRLRLRVPALLLVVMLAVAGAVLYLLLDEAAERTQKGTGTGVTKAPPGEQIVSVKRTSANDYDPLGDDKEEHPEEAPLAVDQDSDTQWTTETYLNDTLNKPLGDEPGVGLYVDAEPSVNARSLEIQTPEPGWTMEIYGARSGPPDEWPSDVWTRLAAATVARTKQSFKLDTGDRHYRYYLVWITALPPEQDQVAITQVTLSARRRPRRRQNAWRRARRWRSSASCSSRSQTSGHGTPAASQSFGNADVGVIPGSVLSSLTSTRPPSSTKKSTRARPAQPTRRNVSTASRRTSAAAASGIAAGTRSSTPPGEYFAS